MKANIIHIDLNPCGGAEQVAIATIDALVESNIDVELTTAKIPNISRLANVFGRQRINAIFNRLRKINLLESLPIGCKSYYLADNSGATHAITINTHGDILPYYLPHFSKTNSITYCHYPVAMELIRQHDPLYLKYLMNLGLVDIEGGKGNGKNDNDMCAITRSDNGSIWSHLQDNYLMMLGHSTIITNSTFSKEAILREMTSQTACDAEKKTVTSPLLSELQILTEPLVVPPPVNTEDFRRAALYSKEKNDLIVVVSRFHPSKKLENAIALARILRRQKIAKGMIIAGSLMLEDRDYYNKIVQMIKIYGVSDYVQLKVNVTSDKLKSIMRKAKVYFHPLAGEPFGISIVEAMSAGLIPVVPSIGGQTDFVPPKYWFSSLKDAAKKVYLALDAPQKERQAVSDMVTISFSQASYAKSIKKIITNLLQKRITRQGSMSATRRATAA